MNEFDLSKFEDDFSKAEVKENQSFDDLPNGKYQVNVEKVELVNSKAGNPMLSWTLKIISSNQKGRLIWRNNVMISPENIKWLKTDLHTCGLDLEKISDLPNRLDSLLDVKLEITRSEKDGHENIFMNKRISGPSQSTSNEAPLPF